MIVYRCDGCNRTLSDEEVRESYDAFNRITQAHIQPSEVFCDSCVLVAEGYWAVDLPNLLRSIQEETTRRVQNFRKDYFKKRPLKAVEVESQKSVGSG